MFETIRFFWNATRGYRLRPWRSPYLRWRLETYTGKKAETVRFSDLLHLAWVERAQMRRFLQWLGSMRRYRHGSLSA